MSSHTSADTRVWLITGASSGIGLATTQEVLAIGERVAATTRRASSLAAWAAQYDPSRLLVLEHDVSAPTPSADELLARIAAHFGGRLDVLVNNAGYGLSGVVEGTSDEEAHRQLDVNFWAAVRLSRAAVRFFREHRNPGSVLNISSCRGFHPNPTLAFYSASKAALDAFSEALHKELDPKWNIKIISVQPGGVRTLWARDNMASLPLPPAYADPESVPNKFKQLLQGHESIGDPNRVGRALIEISKVENPPLRLPLGADALAVIQSKLNDVQRELDEWRELELSTAADDADPGFIEMMLKTVAAKRA